MFTRIKFALVILFGPYREMWDLYQENASLKSAFKTLAKEADELRWKVEHELRDGEWKPRQDILAPFELDEEGDKKDDNAVKRDE